MAFSISHVALSIGVLVPIVVADGLLRCFLFVFSRKDFSFNQFQLFLQFFICHLFENDSLLYHFFNSDDRFSKFRGRRRKQFLKKIDHALFRGNKE